MPEEAGHRFYATNSRLGRGWVKSQCTLLLLRQDQGLGTPGVG